MKWTKLAEEFVKGQPLFRLMHGDVLVDDPGTPVNLPETNIMVSKNHNPLIDNCFRIYKNKKSLSNVISGVGANPILPGNYHPWVHHDKLPDEYFEPMYFAKEAGYHIPHPYEIFCGAWIHFHDTEVRHGETDHALYFKWDPRPGIRSVTVYILQTKLNIGWNVYVKVSPPAGSSQDPPPLPGPPPPYC